MATNDAKLTLDLSVQVLSFNNYHTLTRKIDYKWAESVNDKEKEDDERPFNFGENMIKTYVPDELPRWGQHLSVNYD
jgi:hypothetical protein